MATQKDFRVKNGIIVGDSADISNDLTVNSNTLYVDSANNRVGVGTSSPSEKLQVSENIDGLTRVAISNEEPNGLGASEIDIRSNSARAIFGIYGSNYGGALFGESHDNAAAFFTSITDSPSRFVMGTRTNIPYQIATNDLIRLIVDGSGNVGIGTSSPDNTLDVNGSTTIRGNLDLPATGTETRSIEIGRGRSGNGFSFIDLIGDPVYSDYGFRIIRARSGENARSAIEHRGTGPLQIITRDAAPTAFSNNGSERMRIDSSGNVGIGTSSPSSELQVNGQISADRIKGFAARGGNTTTFFDFNAPEVTSEDAIARFFRNTNTTGDVSILFHGGDGTSTLSSLLNLRGGDSFFNATGGNVGIGTSSPGERLTIGSGNVELAENSVLFNNSTLDIRANNNQSTTSHALELEARGPNDRIAFKVDDTEHMRVNSSGNVGIGTSSPSQKLEVRGEANNGAAYIRGGGGGDSWGLEIGAHNVDAESDLVFNVNAVVGSQDSLNFVAETGGIFTWNVGGNSHKTGNAGSTEAMRIDSSGNLLIGATGANFANLGIRARSSGYLSATRDSNYCLVLNRLTNTGDIQRFYQDSSQVGSISVTTTSTSYNTSSDYRLKENVTELSDGIERLKHLPVHRFNFIKDPDTTVDGFIAHEVQPYVPEAVTGEKDGVDEDGNPEYQGIDQAKLVPLLTASLQEAIKRIETLEAQVASLTNNSAQ